MRLRPRDGGPGGAQPITVQGESAARTNIPVRRDRRASGGALLALETNRRPPSSGWYATYEVEVPAPGPYRLEAVATVPVEHPQVEETGSYFGLSVDDGPPVPVARSQPFWYESAPAWGDLARLDLGVVELRAPRQDRKTTITFVVDEPSVLSTSTGYRFLLDRFTLTPVTRVDLTGIHLGGTDTLGVHRGDDLPELRFVFQARTDRARRLPFTVTDYFGERVAAGTVTLPAGRASASVTLPELPPGHYRVTAAGVTSCFARLPERRPVPGGHFGVNAYVFSLVPPSRLAAFASAMREMGAAWVRDGMAWPAAESRRGAYDTRLYEGVQREFREQGLAVLDVLTTAPEWAMTDASLPLTADLRDAYRYTARLAASSPDAVQLSNEPDIDTTSSTGDQHAAFVKAAALGIRDTSRSTTVVLPGIADAGSHFQTLMLQSDVARYADAWAFHGYPDAADQDEPEVPEAADVQREVRRLYGAEGLPMWMTECGAFLSAAPGTDLTPAQQAVQARYLVRSTVLSLAAGTERHFWFGAPPIHDDGVYFGLLSRDFQPWPAYSAHAALASLLGEARFVERLPGSAQAYVFAAGEGRHVLVAWSGKESETQVTVPAGGEVEVYDIMGRRVGKVTRSGPLTVTADPVYVVYEGQTPDGTGSPTRHHLSPADHIVLSQRFAAAAAAPNKADGDTEPPLGYRLRTTTRMSVDVYNFNDAPATVTVAGRAFGGWTVRPARRTVTVPQMGQVAAEFTLVAGKGVRRGVDHPLSFEATLDGFAVPPSVSRIQRRARRRGRPLPLAPSITEISTDGCLKARITDTLSGVDPARVTVEVDGRRVPAHYDTRTGLLTAVLDQLGVGPGRHEVWIRAYNRAHAPAQATATYEVAG
ncbi:hypothetical protein PV367_41190 [Streptomyces europaeiscabiei]|uniref:Asl1-like glycosyl hydrolase catalytic domain-containing protein n=1 Tax=Streptomyces europaeiscabiei TaxID=146819 RepID=A0AAJ2PYG5_9ACTN|nr:hypothetical protein [Streptomyces europaeiscabiei]MDX3136070.1 hypothetical protein [Streptomyces europaeiscabiei]